jgi:hypothetical protein
MPRLGRRGNAENPFAVKDELIADPALAMQSDAAVLRGQLGHLDADVDDVADLDRTEKAQGLRYIDCAWSRQPHAYDPGNKARGVEPMNDSAAKTGLAGEVLGQVDRIVSPESSANPITSSFPTVLRIVARMPIVRSSKCSV